MDLISQVRSGNDAFLAALPYELLFRIALQLDLPDIQRLCRVSQVFNELCQDDYFWLSLYRRDISQVRPPSVTTSARQSYQQIMTQFSNLQPNQALVEASYHGYDRLVKKILEQITTPSPTILNEVMASASRGGHRDIVNQMLNRGADDYNSAMAWAARGGHDDIVNQMLNLGANSYNGAMAWAARGGHRDIINQMLDLGANDYNWTMIEAAEGDHEDIVKQMLDLGANNYRLGIIAARRSRHPEIINLIRQYQSRRHT
jgi:hypothetical protein